MARIGIAGLLLAGSAVTLAGSPAMAAKGPAKLYGKGRRVAASAVIRPGSDEAVRLTPGFHR